MGMLLRLAGLLFADRWLIAAVPAIAAAAISAQCRQAKRGDLKDREHRAARCFCTNA